MINWDSNNTKTRRRVVKNTANTETALFLKEQVFYLTLNRINLKIVSRGK